MADEKPKGIDPLHDPAWQTHQQRNLVGGDVLLFQTEVYGTRARFYLGSPLNAKEIRWEWATDLAQEEVSWLAVDFSYTAMLLARKGQGAITHLAGQSGTLGAKVAELQGLVEALEGRLQEMTGEQDASDPAAPERTQDEAGGEETAL